MIVDVHTHVWDSPDQWGPQIAALLRQRLTTPMDRADANNQAHSEAAEAVDAAFVLGFRSRRLGAEVPTALLTNYIITAPEKLIGFAGVDPMDEHCLDEIDALSFRRMRGIVISPAEQGFHPQHSRAMKLYEKCQTIGVPIIVHQGEEYVRDSMLEHAPPWLFDPVARDFPNLKLLFTHCGHPWTEQMLILLGKHRNAYAELSGLTLRPRQLFHTLIQAHHLDVTDRLLLGSDFPRQTPQQAIAAIYSLNQMAMSTMETLVPREKLRAIVERDAMEAMGLSVAAIKASAETPADRPVSQPVQQESRNP